MRTKRFKGLCKNCNEEMYDFHSTRTYCNNKCQREYEWKLKKEKIEKGKIDSPKALRRYILERDGVLCKICNNTEWNGKEIPLVLDHINGDPYNNFPDNLRLICPNCDAQTEFYKGKNKGRGRDHRMKRYYEGKTY
jgi:5-methylcytosine-specific restriction endonuclease McrA